jgi:hypothetical protein
MFASMMCGLSGRERFALLWTSFIDLIFRIALQASPNPAYCKALLVVRIPHNSDTFIVVCFGLFGRPSK